MNDTVQGEGRRARKRRETRARIVEAALSLFLARGFDGATVDEIAAAADVSKRSFFDYFPSKEDVVQDWHDAFADRLVAELAARPPGEAALRAIECAMLEALRATTDERSLVLGRLVFSTPALAARSHLKYAKLETRLAEALVDRLPGADFEARLVAVIVVGLLRHFAQEMQAVGGVTAQAIEDATRQAFSDLRRACARFAAEG